MGIPELEDLVEECSNARFDLISPTDGDGLNYLKLIGEQLDKVQFNFEGFTADYR